MMLDSRTKPTAVKNVVSFEAPASIHPRSARGVDKSARKSRSTSAQHLHSVSGRPAGHLRKHTRAHCFGRGVAVRTRGGRAGSRGRSHVDSVRSGGRCPSWSGDDSSIGTGTAGANDAGCTFDGVCGRNDAGQQGKDSRDRKQRRFHQLSPRGVVFREDRPPGSCAARTRAGIKRRSAVCGGDAGRCGRVSR